MINIDFMMPNSKLVGIFISKMYGHWKEAKGCFNIRIDDIYHNIVNKDAKIWSRMSKLWDFQRLDLWRRDVVKRRSHSCLLFKVKGFIWWVMGGGLLIGDASRRSSIDCGACFFRTILVEHT